MAGIDSYFFTFIYLSLFSKWLIRGASNYFFRLTGISQDSAFPLALMINESLLQECCRSKELAQCYLDFTWYK